MYPEVHFPKEANLRWSGVEEQFTPSATMAHRNLLALSHNARCHEPLSGGLEGDDRNLYQLGALFTT